MKPATNVKEFVERVDNSKKVNPKDLSSDQDLSIGIMNLISIEEHLMFSGAKTEKTSFYDLIDSVREIRKDLMHKLIPTYEGEVWCISKHLLSASMRLMEVGTKQLSMGNKDDAYKLFDQAYELYCMFWGLNMNLIDSSNLKWIEDKPEDVKKIIDKVASSCECDSDGKGESCTLPLSNKQPTASKRIDEKEEKDAGTFSKLKSFVRKAVDCCIE